MRFSKKKFLSSILDSRKRLAIPVLTSPGVVLAGLKPCEAFRDGEKQFRAIAALAKRFPAAAQVTFMDLTLEAEAFGSTLVFPEDENPNIPERLLNDPSAVDALKVPEAGACRTGEVLKCAALCAGKLDRPVFGGMIGPFSLAGRLLDVSEMMMAAIAEPDTAHALLEKTSEFLRKYILALKETGIAGVMIAEPTAGLVSPEMSVEFSYGYIKKIIDGIPSDDFMVTLHNCGRTEEQAAAMAETGVDAIHIGNAVKVTDILPEVPSTIPVMGNIDPARIIKDGTPEQVYSESAALLKATAEYPNFVFSSGCDVPFGTPEANIDAFFKACEDYNSQI